MHTQVAPSGEHKYNSATAFSAF